MQVGTVRVESKLLVLWSRSLLLPDKAQRLGLLQEERFEAGPVQGNGFVSFHRSLPHKDSFIPTHFLSGLLLQNLQRQDVHGCPVCRFPSKHKHAISCQEPVSRVQNPRCLMIIVLGDWRNFMHFFCVVPACDFYQIIGSSAR